MHRGSDVGDLAHGRELDGLRSHVDVLELRQQVGDAVQAGGLLVVGRDDHQGACLVSVYWKVVSFAIEYFT